MSHSPAPAYIGSATAKVCYCATHSAIIAYATAGGVQNKETGRVDPENWRCHTNPRGARAHYKLPRHTYARFSFKITCTDAITAQMPEGGRWRGVCKGVTGWFPSKHVLLAPSTPKPPQPKLDTHPSMIKQQSAGIPVHSEILTGKGQDVKPARAGSYDSGKPFTSSLAPVISVSKLETATPRTSDSTTKSDERDEAPPPLPLLPPPSAAVVKAVLAQVPAAIPAPSDPHPVATSAPSADDTFAKPSESSSRRPSNRL